MSSYIDLKFINQLSGRLQQFKQKTDYLFNFRCPHCGDSKKSKSKARAYFYRVKNDMFFKCHNCGNGQNLANFIKFIDQHPIFRTVPTVRKPRACDPIFCTVQTVW